MSNFIEVTVPVGFKDGEIKLAKRLVNSDSISLVSDDGNWRVLVLKDDSIINVKESYGELMEKLLG